jgi:hypothetical protein
MWGMPAVWATLESKGYRQSNRTKFKVDSHELQPARTGELRESERVKRRSQKRPRRENSKEKSKEERRFFVVFAQFAQFVAKSFFLCELKSDCPYAAWRCLFSSGGLAGRIAGGGCQ